MGYFNGLRISDGFDILLESDVIFMEATTRVLMPFWNVSRKLITVQS